MAFHVEGKYREAIADFEQAAAANKRLGDPHFGLGMILYELAIFDLVKRGRYEIRGNGTFGFDPQRGVVVTKAPDLSVAPDDRSKFLLQSALEEFEKGKYLGNIIVGSTTAAQILILNNIFKPGWRWCDAFLATNRGC